MKEDARFLISLVLENHPITNEKNIYKQNYINALNYFVCKYSNKDVYAKNLLGIYNKHFNDNFKINLLNEVETKKCIKKICGLKIQVKNFKLFTYRLNFIHDCLLINAYDNPILAQKIIDEFKAIFSSRNHKYLDTLYEILYSNKDVDFNGKFKLLQHQITNWIENKKFIKKPLETVLVTATMSAGKSTLINSIIGKNLAKTKNEACTAKISSCFNKVLEDNIICKESSSKSVNYITNLVDVKLNDNEDVKMSTYMNLSKNYNNRLCIIDTPGVNSSLNKDHKKATESALKNIYFDKLIYVINANNIGSDDDMKHMINIFETNKQNKPVIFVLNKLDTFRLKEDSIEESIKALKKDLENIGFKYTTVCPISAYAAGLFKKLLKGDILNEDEELDCNRLLRKFSKEEYNLSNYYDKKCEVALEVNDNISFEKYDSEQIIKCLYNTGIMNLEELIMKGKDI